jgi:hypothetical protein
MCAQFSDICFGGAPHGGHSDPAKMEKVFPVFELRFADVLAPPPLSYYPYMLELCLLPP